MRTDLWCSLAAGRVSATATRSGSGSNGQCEDGSPICPPRACSGSATDFAPPATDDAEFSFIDLPVGPSRPGRNYPPTSNVAVDETSPSGACQSRLVGLINDDEEVSSRAGEDERNHRCDHRCIVTGVDVDWRRAAAYVVCRDADGRLLLTRFLSETHPLSGSWAMPGGGMDWGETPTQTALRELHEETGLTASIGSVLGVYSEWFTPAEAPNGTAGHHIGIVYGTSNVEGELRTEFDPGTTDGAQWFHLTEIQSLPRTGIVDFVLDLL